MKKYIIVSWLWLIIAAILAGCVGKTSLYCVVGNDVYLGGELLSGSTPRKEDIELTLSNPAIKEGAEIGLDYFGTHYAGIVKSNNRITWETTPKIAEGIYSNSTIENYNSSIRLIFYYYLNGLELKDVLLFSEK